MYQSREVCSQPQNNTNTENFVKPSLPQDHICDVTFKNFNFIGKIIAMFNYLLPVLVGWIFFFESILNLLYKLPFGKC